jgi:hypothetical protein
LDETTTAICPNCSVTGTVPSAWVGRSIHCRCCDTHFVICDNKLDDAHVENIGSPVAHGEGKTREDEFLEWKRLRLKETPTETSPSCLRELWNVWQKTRDGAFSPGLLRAVQEQARLVRNQAMYHSWPAVEIMLVERIEQEIRRMTHTHAAAMARYDYVNHRWLYCEDLPDDERDNHLRGREYEEHDRADYDDHDIDRGDNYG